MKFYPILVVALALVSTGCKNKLFSFGTGHPTHRQANEEGDPPALPRLVDAEDLAAEEGLVRINLRAQTHTYDINGTEVTGYGYEGMTPGPIIRTQVGDTLEVNFTNELPESATTVHWHGLHVPIDMDGVVWQRSPVAAGESFLYTFTIDQGAATYWYHPHFDTDRQLDLGLYGVLIVEDPNEPQADDEVVLVFDSWDENKSKDHVHDHGEIDGARLVWTVNGARQPVYTAAGGSRVRARLVNVSNAGYLKLSWPGIRHIAGDQGLLPALQEPTSILLAPGDRADVEWLIGEEGFAVTSHPYTLAGGDAYGVSETLMTVAVSDPAPAPEPLAWPFAGTAASADPGHTDIIYMFQGSSRTGTWAINGEQFPDVTIPEIPLNTELIIEVRNLSPSEHPFHIHGHGFEVLSINGMTLPYRTFEDNINVGIYETVRLRMVADNPGDWMTHCHILPHQSGGMMTILRVLE